MIYGLYSKALVGQANINSAESFFKKVGLEYFEKQNYAKAAIEFEKSIEKIHLTMLIMKTQLQLCI